MKVLSYLAFLTLLLGLFLTAVSLRYPKGRNRAMALAGLLFAWWSLCMMFVYGSEQMESAMFWYKISLPGILFLIPAFYWICLDQAGFRFSSRVAAVGIVVVASTIFYFQYFAHGFFFERFVPGPWGNVGIVSQQTFWYLVASGFYTVTHFMVLFILVRARQRATSKRYKRQLMANILGLVMIVILFGVAISLEYAGFPPTDLFVTAVYLVGVNFYLIGQYSYLRDEPFLELNHLSDHISDAMFLLHRNLTVENLNLSARKLWDKGQSPVGKPFFSLFDHPEALKKQWDDASNRSETVEIAVATRNGHSYRAELTPHLDKFGDLCGVVALVAPQPDSLNTQRESGLTLREQEICSLIVRGLGNKSISTALYISPATVRTHIYNIYQKLGVQSRLELINKSIKQEIDLPKS